LQTTKVKEKRRGRPSKEQPSLSKTLIINTAKQSMERSKSVPSIRALASELKVDAMAIYYYFKNKETLLEAITTSLISDMYQPVKSDDWQSELLRLSKNYLETLDKYDGLLKTLLTMKSDSPAAIFTARFREIIQVLALDEKKEGVFLDLLIDYLHGFSLAKSCDTSSILSINDIDVPMTLMFKGVTAN
jgi:AcrR family transcriptional regulator